ncbi:MAG: hypothetical protein WA755_05525 [Candidatus Acidiferrales bacterium]
MAIFAIWGDYYRSKWAGPQLTLLLKNPCGDLFPRGDGKRAYYFHLKIKNKRDWSPAKDVRVLIERAARPRPDGSFVLEPLAYPLPLAWTPSELKDFQRTVFDSETCDVGFLTEGTDRFKLSTIFTASNFRDYVTANDALRLRVVASGRNAASKPLFLEIRWNGNWSADKDEMRNYLVVKEIETL